MAFTRTYDIALGKQTFKATLDLRAINAFDAKHGSILRVAAQLAVLVANAKSPEETPLAEVFSVLKAGEVVDLVTEAILSGDPQSPPRAELEATILRGNIVPALEGAIPLLTSLLASEDDAPAEVEQRPLAKGKKAAK